VGEPPAGVPAPACATLFEANRSWKLTGKLDHSRSDEKPKKTSKSFTSTGAWCFELTMSAGDDGWQTVCLDAKRGFVSGKYGWAGGSSDEVTFTAK
jgi:hypothetical protein